jgi:hypothetical protein
MQAQIWQLATILSLYLLGSGTVHAISLDIVDKLDIKAIKSINLNQTEDEFRAAVAVQFSNSAKAALKFRNANFVITFKNDTGNEIFLGTTKPKELYFPASKDGSARLKEEVLDVYVGKNVLDTITRLIALFNLIGNPDSEFAMILSGTTEVGTKAKRGWIYQGEVELEKFTFHPTIQREVLFK